jgi:hypothetical protein
VKDATYKNKLNLSGKRVAWLLIKYFGPFFNATKALSMVTVRLDCFRFNNSSAFCGLFLGENTFR